MCKTTAIFFWQKTDTCGNEKNITLPQFMESHGILEQFFNENMDMKVCVLFITAMNIHSKNSCCILTAYL